MTFAHDRNTETSLLSFAERPLKRRLAAQVSRFVGTRTLTMVTLPLAVAAFASSAAHWWTVTAALVAAQYLTDLVDGEVGRILESGHVRWGYHMDHFLDAVFVAAIFGGYLVALPGARPAATALLVVCMLFLVNAHLESAATGTTRLKRGRVGPTEIRGLLVVADLAMARFGTRWFEAALPWIAATGVGLLAIAVYCAQRAAATIDQPS
ncbi:hypothetical protein KBX03_03080 [Micromonospora sp. C72]|uniref:CDP-alcohol phosphatidyltransferase family protein n=1 Tax=Micromonospora sp. C72 TaxID=2824880 RepID=UPI001B367C2E|nr:CDP-alcohol phosphatidyltransferase family protein [Micromonospora sp. C72]MBQ1041484.1 hypothetical protein [Micromonospora sp. C72]